MLPMNKIIIRMVNQNYVEIFSCTVHYKNVFVAIAKILPAQEWTIMYIKGFGMTSKTSYFNVV